MRVARYRPLLGWPRAEPARLPGPACRQLFGRGREALAAWFAGLGRGEVLVSAQICPAVPFLLRRMGFTPVYLDLDPVFPCPSGEAFARAVTERTVAVLASPMYGLAREWKSWQGPPLVLDLAQGLGAWPELCEQAEAVVYSFGLGKGADTGGGLLCSRQKVSVAGTSLAPFLGTVAQGVALRGLLASGLYRFFVQRGVALEKEDRPVHPRRGPAWLEGFCLARVAVYLEQAELARRRYRELPGALAEYAECLPLRAILRLPQRDRVLARLRERGIDAEPAGEPLPGEYDPGAGGPFPQAERFLAEGLRLPFLGRLSPAEFEHVKRSLP